MIAESNISYANHCYATQAAFNLSAIYWRLNWKLIFRSLLTTNFYHFLFLFFSSNQFLDILFLFNFFTSNES
jgi:hypothetical protein